MLVVAAVLSTELLLEGRFQHSGFQRVTPGADGRMSIDISGLQPLEVRYFRFLNRGNQEVKFFVAKDGAGTVHVAFDANETCAKLKRGYRHEGEWLVCNKCDKAFRIAEVNAGGGGCKPVTLAHRIADGHLLLTADDVLAGWRYFH